MKNILVLPLVAAVMWGCSQPDVPTQLGMIEHQLRAGEAKKAVIQAKSLLQDNADLTAARILLARGLLDLSKPKEAAVELRKLEFDPSKVDNTASTLLARALFESGESNELIKRFKSIEEQSAGNAELHAFLSMAYLSLGDILLAKQAAARAIKTDPASPRACVAMADIEHTAGDRKSATAQLKQCAERTPNDTSTLMRLGVWTAQDSGDLDAAAQYLRQALKINDNLLTARSNLIQILLGRGAYHEAERELEKFKAELPGHPQTLFFESQIALSKKNSTRALELIQAALKTSPDFVLGLELAGRLLMGNGQFRLAEQYLAKGLGLAPAMSAIRYTLAELQLKTGRFDTAMETLRPLLESGNTDAKTHFLASEANFASGNVAASIKHLELVEKLQPQNAAASLQLILARTKSPTAKETIDEISKLAQRDKGMIADLALINLFTQTKEFPAALRAADGLEKKGAENAQFALSIRGEIYISMGDISNARREFESLYKANPKSITAVERLGSLDTREGKFDEALSRYQRFLSEDPKNLQALLGAASIVSAGGKGSEQYVKLLQDAISAQPESFKARALLATHYLRVNDPKQALIVSEAAVASLPNDPDALDLNGKVLVSNGQLNQAAATYGKLITLKPKSPYPYLRLSAIQMAMNDNRAAESTLKRGLQVDPNFFPTQEAFIKLAVAERRVDAGMSFVRDIQRRQPDAAAGYMLEGDLQSQLGKTAEAIATYRSTLKRFSSRDVALRLHTLLTKVGRHEEAEEVVRSWQKMRPSDTAFLTVAGDLAMARRAYAVAERHFQSILAIEPKNAIILNNLAWVTAAQHKKGAAEIAERASALRPADPGIMDTLAFALASEGQVMRAIDIQKRSIEVAPKDLGLKLNLAKLYLRAGNKDLAKDVLAKLAAMGKEFPAQAEVSELLRGI